MPRPKIAVGAVPPWYPAAFEQLTKDLTAPGEFSPEVVAAAEAAAARPIEATGRADRRDLELITLDPATSMDLDQAFAIEARGNGHRVSYAIADVAAFVRAGDAVDLEAHRRVETRYAPDRRIPLHPPQLSEAAASLLPDQDRPAVLWTLDLDAVGDLVASDVTRAVVRSRAKLGYEAVQAQVEAGTADATIQALRTVGELRLAAERTRGGVSLPLPEQVVDVDGQTWRIAARLQSPVETWNAQLSLLTGIAAARMMLDGGIGLLRTLPPPDAESIAGLRRRATALGFAWPDAQPYPEFVRAIDPAAPRAAALLRAAATLFRGAGYLAFDGEAPAGDTGVHAAIAAPYAHVTAPLRRLADRYAAEVCLALRAGVEVPSWVRAALPGLPAEMAGGTRAVNSFAAESLNLVEAGLLAERLGETFTGTVVATNGEGKGTVLLADPVVETKVTGTALPLGEAIRVTLVAADPMTRQIRFEAVENPD